MSASKEFELADNYLALAIAALERAASHSKATVENGVAVSTAQTLQSIRPVLRLTAIDAYRRERLGAPR